MKKKKKKKKLYSRTAHTYNSCFVQWRRRHHLYVYRLYYSLIAEHNANKKWGHKLDSNGDFPMSKMYRKRESKETEDMNKKKQPRYRTKTGENFGEIKEKIRFETATENEYFIHKIKLNRYFAI